MSDDTEIYLWTAGRSLDSMVSVAMFGENRAEDWHPSTDFSHAMQIVDIFRRGAHLWKSRHVAACVELHWYDTVGDHDSNCTIFAPSIAKTSITAETMELAIAVCALTIADRYAKED